MPWELQFPCGTLLRKQSFLGLSHHPDHRHHHSSSPIVPRARSRPIHFPTPKKAREPLLFPLLLLLSCALQLSSARSGSPLGQTSAERWIGGENYFKQSRKKTESNRLELLNVSGAANLFFFVSRISIFWSMETLRCLLALLCVFLAGAQSPRNRFAGKFVLKINK